MDVDHGRPGLVRHLVERFVTEVSSVVDKNLDVVWRQPRVQVWVSDRARCQRHASCQILCRLREEGRVKIVENDVRPLVGKSMGVRQAQATTGASDQCLCSG